MNLIPNYPKKDGDRYLYVRMPIKVTETVIKKYKQHYGVDSVELHTLPKGDKPPVVTSFIIGHWITVNVTHDGFAILPFPIQYEDEAILKKVCDSSNRFCGFSKEESLKIIHQSMLNYATPKK